MEISKRYRLWVHLDRTNAIFNRDFDNYQDAEDAAINQIHAWPVAYNDICTITIIREETLDV